MNMAQRIILITQILLLIVSCVFFYGQLKERTVPNEEVISESIGITGHKDTSYKLFYGTWRVSKLISQHLRLNGDEGYEQFLGRIVEYGSDYYISDGEKVDNPNYQFSIIPISNESSFFFPEQASVTGLLPDAQFFVFVQIVGMSYLDSNSEEYIGMEFLIKDNNTMYIFNKNCLYELTRVSFMDDYDARQNLTYQER